MRRCAGNAPCVRGSRFNSERGRGNTAIAAASKRPSARAGRTSKSLSRRRLSHWSRPGGSTATRKFGRTHRSGKSWATSLRHGRMTTRSMPWRARSSACRRAGWIWRSCPIYTSTAYAGRRRWLSSTRVSADLTRVRSISSRSLRRQFASLPSW
jgi:hypothetical protein